MKEYMVQLVGCHDSNHLTVNLSEAEYATINRVAELLTANSHSECEPTMRIYEVLND
jgi:flagellar basal body P-ring protein FlgI